MAARKQARQNGNLEDALAVLIQNQARFVGDMAEIRKDFEQIKAYLIRLGGASLLKLLLDTHIWIWSLMAPQHLTKKILKALRSEDNELWLSSIGVNT